MPNMTGLRKVTKREHKELKRIIKDHGIDHAALHSGLCERTLWTINRNGTKKNISPKTQESLSSLFNACDPAELRLQQLVEPDLRRELLEIAALALPDPEDDQVPPEPTQQPVPPLLGAVTKAIHEGILEAERGRQPMIHLLQAAVLRLESKMDLLAKCQLDEMVAWGLRESPNGNRE